MQLDRLTLGRMAKELGFVRDTLEKVCRLADVLKFMESDELLSKGIALKGGTAEVKLPWSEEVLIVLSVAPLEIFASKTVALLTRTTPRDLYDMHNMVKYGLFDESEEEMFRKCAVFYSAIGAEQPPEKFELDNIGKVSAQQIKRDLDPVLRKGERFDLEMVQREVKEYLASILMPTREEKLFWKAFSKGGYHPDWIFGKSDELVNVAKHPMALWKCRNKAEDKIP